MLYSLIVILSISIPPMCLFSFRWGFRYGKDGKTAAEKKIAPQISRKRYKESKEMERQRKIMQNMENYSGDGSNQADI